MPSFSDDIDLLSYEPNLFKDAAWASQALYAGTGDLAGTTLTLVTGTLTDRPVVARQVVVLSGASINGSYPIVTRVSDTQLIISTLYDDLLSEGSAASACPVGTVTGLTVTIRTFSPQAATVGGLIVSACGINPGTSDEQDVQIVNADALRTPSILGTLAMIFSAMSGVEGAPASYAVRAGFYERAFHRAVRSIRVQLDTNGDGVADVVRPLDLVQFYRH